VSLPLHYNMDTMVNSGLRETGLDLQDDGVMDNFSSTTTAGGIDHSESWVRCVHSVGIMNVS
jgi:hypothetical protein